MPLGSSGSVTTALLELGMLLTKSSLSVNGNRQGKGFSWTAGRLGTSTGLGQVDRQASLHLLRRIVTNLASWYIHC